MDQYSILDQTSSGGAREVSPPAAAAKEESVPPLPPRIPADSGSKSLAEMAQRDLEAALQLLAERAQYITGASGAAIALLEDSEMICRASAGPSAPALGAEVQMKTGLTGESVRSRQILRCDDAESDSRVNRESCRALGIKSVMVVPLLNEQEVIGVFELLADRANAFEERDVTALKRLAEMVQTGLEHAAAAKRGLPEIAANHDAANHDEEAQQKAHEPAATDLAKENGDLAAQGPAPEAQDTIVPKADRSTPVQPAMIEKIGKCEGCGFPVSEGRTLCVDCEAARFSGDSPAPLASSHPPAFLAQLGKEQTWLASHIYTIGTVLIVILTVVLLVLRLR